MINRLNLFRPILSLSLFFAYLQLNTLNVHAVSLHETQTVEPVCRNILVFSAASLSPVLDALHNRWKEKHPNCPIVIAPGPSATLARQIKAGAPADIFLSAHPEWTELVLQAKSSSKKNKPRALAYNRLVLASRSSPINWTKATVEDYLLTKPIIIGDPALAPLGRYGMAALTKLLGTPPSPDRQARAPSARHTVAMVERTSMAGILYASDLVGRSHLLRATEIPESYYPQITYQGVITTRGKNIHIARQFMDYITHDDQNDLWQQFGFTPFVSQ